MTFLNEKEIKRTRKSYRCAGCGTEIGIGSTALRWTGIPDGEFVSAVYHADCRTAEIALNDMYGFGGDDWVSLLAIHEEPENVGWLVTTHLSVASRMGLPK